MLKGVAFLLGSAGLTAAGSAATTVAMLVSTDGVNFSNTVNLVPNTGIRTVEVIASVSTNTANALGLGSFQFQPTVSNWSGTDALAPFTAPFGSNTSTPSGAVADSPGQYGRITPFAAVLSNFTQRLFGHVHLSSGGANQPPSGTYLRIAQQQVTSWIGGTGNSSGGSGVNIKQLNNIGRTATDPAYNPSVTNVHVLRFAVQVDTAVFPRVLVVDAPAAGFGNRSSTTGERQIYWYADLNEAVGSIRETPSIQSGAINLIPAPSSMILIGLGGLAVSRRRRG